MNDEQKQKDHANQMKQLGVSFIGMGCLIMMLPIIIVCFVIVFSIIGSMF